MKKFFDSTLGLGFTLSGAVVMYFTLSGFTQKVALIATVLALIAHYWLVFKEPND
jgi:hypothetical protein